MNGELKTKSKNDFERDFFKLINNSVFGKSMENVRKHSDIKLRRNDKQRNYLVSEPNYHQNVKMNKRVYLWLSIPDISQIAIYEYWYDYAKPKCSDNAKLYCMNMDSFIVHLIPEDMYEDLAGDVKQRISRSNYQVERQLPIVKNRLMKDESA